MHKNDLGDKNSLILNSTDGSKMVVRNTDDSTNSLVSSLKISGRSEYALIGRYIVK